MNRTDRIRVGVLSALGALFGASLLYSRMPWPVSPAVITSPFGDRVDPDTGRMKKHNGVDLRAANGTPVTAPAAGYVSLINNTPSGGNQLFLRLDGYADRVAGFAHLSAYAVEVGDIVRPGDLIAYSGSTGTVRGAHLHYTLKDGSDYLDPERYHV